ncbi:MAG: hypothetical protein IJH04_02685 [Eggerthellaceae bacterium]|nr:hypothetical protein [Eggerthellaceae bacterium]
MAQANMREVNSKRIDERLEAGLALLRERYKVTECSIDPSFENPVVAGRPNHVRRFDIEGVGNLLMMTAKDVEVNQLSSFVLMPYYKNLPLFSTDYVYTDEKRFFLIEIYDLSVRHDAVYDQGIGSFAAIAEAWSDMPEFPTQPRWYDKIRPVCIAKAPSCEQDDLSLERFLEALRLFVEMEQATPLLEGADLTAKWQLNKDYSDGLIDEGGVSTDMWTAALGAENVRRFFDEVFFGPACYTPAGK